MDTFRIHSRPETIAHVDHLGTAETIVLTCSILLVIKVNVVCGCHRLMKLSQSSVQIDILWGEF